MDIDTIFKIAILVFSVIVHEVSHGAMAMYLGDMTAKRAGRLTLNPLPHIDPMGSVILPALMALSHSPILFGWAKPVPYNPYNLTRGGRWGEALVAFAGPASNFIIALVFSYVIRMGVIPVDSIGLAYVAVYMNLFLGVFNLIPIPPLDGSKVLPSLLPQPLAAKYEQLTRQLNNNPMMGFGFVVVLILFFGSILSSFVFKIAEVILGL